MQKEVQKDMDTRTVMVLWMYTGIVRHMLTHGYREVHKMTNQKGTHRSLKHPTKHLNRYIHQEPYVLYTGVILGEMEY